MSFELINELTAKLELLEQETRKLPSLGYQYAEKEREYKILKAEKTLEVRGEGYPVTLTETVVMGMKDVAMARFERDCAKTMYEAAQESINCLKLSCRILDAQVSREWHAR